MGVYLVPIDLADLDLGADGGYAIVDRLLTGAGLAGLDSVTGAGPGFEEKLDVSPRSFDDALAAIDVTAAVAELPTPPGADTTASPASSADMWLPIAFRGVLTVPDVPGNYHPELRLASAVDIAARCAALARSMNFPSDEVPELEASGYTLSGWRHSLTQPGSTASSVVTDDPDLSFYLALYSSVAAYSLEHHAAVGYA